MSILLCTVWRPDGPRVSLTRRAEPKTRLGPASRMASSALRRPACQPPADCRRRPGSSRLAPSCPTTPDLGFHGRDSAPQRGSARVERGTAVGEPSEGRKALQRGIVISVFDKGSHQVLYTEGRAQPTSVLR